MAKKYIYVWLKTLKKIPYPNTRFTENQPPGLLFSDLDTQPGGVWSCGNLHLPSTHKRWQRFLQDCGLKVSSGGLFHIGFYGREIGAWK
jgi:hypothetical protein